jgi:serine protease inhibitor
MRMKFYITLLVVILGMASCKKDTNPPPAYKDLQLPAEAGTIINSSNITAFKIFNKVLSSEENQNTLVSPLSIYMALGMVYNGADNATRDSIGRVLEIEGNGVDNLNATAKALIEQLPGEDNKVSMSIANSIWYKKNDVQPIQSFLDICNENFKAIISALDFSSPSALANINSWVSDKTNGKIPKILESIDDSDLMFLVNAIYFNGSWKYSFDPANTYNTVFHGAQGHEINTPFMSQELTVSGTSNENFELVELPYGTGKAFSMFIILPKNASVKLNPFVATLNESILADAIAQMQESKMKIIIPKWEYSYNWENFKDQLKAMGMAIAFTDSADFSKMYPRKVHITKAVHKTYIKVNEAGTEAAAATAIGITLTSAPSQPREFRADHPFVYIIAEKQTGTILFTGTLSDPSKN